MSKPIDSEPLAPWRLKLHTVIFEADTVLGQVFDILLLLAILASVTAVCLDSVEQIKQDYHTELLVAEWVFTIGFTIEYVLRIISVKRPFAYIFSFYGIVDLLAILPTYLSLVFVGAEKLAVVRGLRIMRIFRIFKLAQFLTEEKNIRRALWASRAKAAVFLVGLLFMVVIVGAVMHLIEGPESGFTSIPQSIYWAIVTLTTVGYGDIAPQTVLGKSLASMMMVLGYSFIIIVPMGIIYTEVGKHEGPVSTQACPVCSREGHDVDAICCKYCGEKL
ncbi:MAG: ion transporter [Planctomycetota bacterium]